MNAKMTNDRFTYAGIDAGSRTIKVVLIDGRDGCVVARGMADQGLHQESLAGGLLDDLLARVNLRRADLAGAVATGYGRAAIGFADTTITEITCHAVGVRAVAPSAATVIEIGGQDSKLLRLGADGGVRDFAMNDRCAAGTGRFLELVAARLGVSLERLGELAAASRRPAAISSMCAVFAETEIIGLLAGGTAPEDIAAGVQQSVAARISAMAGRDLAEPVVLTGGVALVGGMDRALSSTLGRPIAIASNPQFTGALGAAILAGRRRATASGNSPEAPGLP